MFYSSSSQNLLDNVTVSYGGDSKMIWLNPESRANIGIDGGQLELTNSTITNSRGYGVYVDPNGTINNIQSASANNTFNSNPMGNVY